MATLSDYMSGTISLANGSVTVTGTGTLFEVTRFREGDTLQIQNLTAVIASVDSDTQLTLTEPWTGASIVNGAYRARQLGDGTRVSTQAATVIELLGNGVLANLAELGVEEGRVPVGGPTGEYELVDPATFGVQDPNGSLGQLAALTLAANKFLNTDASGNITQSDISLFMGDNDAMVNGNFDVWQRGGAFTNSNFGSGSYCADRWLTRFDASGSDRTFNRQSFTPGQTAVPGNPRYFGRYSVTSVGTGGTYRIIEHKTENVFTLAGKRATFTLYLASSTMITLPQIVLRQNFGTGGSPSANVDKVIATSVAVGALWSKFQYVLDVPAVTGKALGTSGDYLSLMLYLPPTATFVLDIARVSRVPGDASTIDDPFQPRPYAQEEQICQRYYRAVTASQRAYAPVAGSTVIYGSTIQHQGMRTTPTATLIDAGNLTAGATQDLTPNNANASRYTITANTVSGDFRQLGATYGLDAELPL